MKRIALAAAAALLGTGCISSNTTTYVPPPNTGAVDFGWSFVRYDATANPIATYGCLQAGIDTVVISFQVGGDVTMPCADASGDGALVTGVAPGTQTVFVTGYRGRHALYQSQNTTLTVATGQTTAVHGVQALGMADNLAVYANFVSRTGAVGYATCAAAGVASIDYVIADWANTTVASGRVDCSDPAGVSFAGNNALDRDQYVIRMRGFTTTTGQVEDFDSATTAVAPTCSGQAFNHYGANDAWDVSLYDVTQNTTFCP